MKMKRLFCNLALVGVLAAGMAFSPFFITKADAASSPAAVEYQHVRNATAKITYGGKTFLVDPFLAPKGAYPGFKESPDRPTQRIPVIDMAEPAEKVIRGVDAVILTHTHLDHWDPEAQMILPKDIPFFVQNAGDARTVREQGFINVCVVGKNTPFGMMTITKVGGQHGTDAMYSVPRIAEGLGDAMGFVLQEAGQKTVYVVGDTNWTSYVDEALETYKPDIVVLNTGYAQITDDKGTVFDGSLIMGTDDVLRMYNAAPDAEIIAVHMDAVNHTMVSSDDMRRFIKKHNLQDRVFVPREGEIVIHKAETAQQK